MQDDIEDNENATEVYRDFQLIPYESLRFEKLETRSLSREACLKFGVGLTKDLTDNQYVLCFPYYDKEGRFPVAQKIRTKDKQFKAIGNMKASGLFGSQLWRNEKGKRLVITEGELDCMSVAQAFNLAWPVVSIRNGAQGASKDIKDNLEFIESFEEVIIWFDNDAPGRKAALECADLVSPGKCKVVYLPETTELKDANDVLKSQGTAVVQRYVYDAKVQRPDGIVCGTEIYDRLIRYRDNPTSTNGYSISNYPVLNDKIRGIRKGRLLSIIAAPKVGKSTLAKELTFDLLMNHNLKLASFGFEESVEETALMFMGLYLNKRIHIDPKGTCTDEEFDEAYKATVGSGRLFLFDHFGSLEPEHLLSRFRYMAVGLGVDFILFDHISIVISGLSTVGGESERRLIGIICTKLRQLIQETGVGVILVSHIRKGKGDESDPETGGRVTPSDVLGSGDVGRISDTLIALEGDVSGIDDTRTIRVLYNRLTGDSGEADVLHYNKETGRLLSKKLIALHEKGIAYEKGTSI